MSPPFLGSGLIPRPPSSNPVEISSRPWSTKLLLLSKSLGAGAYITASSLGRDLGRGTREKKDREEASVSENVRACEHKRGEAKEGEGS